MTFGDTSISKRTQTLVVAFTIYAIWGAHWASVMDEQPFLSGVIAVKTLVAY
ncbi:hypothetical protein J3Q64DRAFT_1828780 [Phycomyces blakesleeanus]|uniref:EamA family transporter n=1 Tax=Phycomyces blakesleeanus TaxID=4837 RepID=A0ABR3BG58_PHYBL